MNTIDCSPLVFILARWSSYFKDLHMDIKEAFAAALKQTRTSKGLTQEDFSNVSSRTYISTLERRLKTPTLDKVEDLAGAMGIHPLTLLTLTYMIERKNVDSAELFSLVAKELGQLASL